MREIGWLTASYLLGIIIDCAAAIQLLVPRVFSLMNQPNNFQANGEYRYASDSAAALMIGWIFILLWAERKPVERRGVLLITVFPVIIGLVVTEIWGIWVQFIPLRALIPVFALQTVLASLFTFSYLNSHRLSKPLLPL